MVGTEEAGTLSFQFLDGSITCFYHFMLAYLYSSHIAVVFFFFFFKFNITGFDDCINLLTGDEEYVA